ncbi:MAG TPA: HAD family phosphatase [Bacteroidales bacterium]|jgi:putative hydrolase of the HAD superfamily|nr:HAD family phosphatase [Bacteroidales bacterium]
MVKNIVFDLGNVLISFIPSEYLKKLNYPANIRNTIIHDIFQSEEWKKLDNGDITVKEAIDSIVPKSALRREEIALVFKLRADIMFPLDDNVRLLPALKNRGFRVFYLSNFHMDIFEIVSHDYYFFRYFDGGIISADVKLSKPDCRIYRLLLDKYSLKPEESLYIDDIEENVVAAEKVGMRGLLTYGSPKFVADLEKKLDIKISV